jgi:ABC-2 type transport system ATP-binding protein
MRTSSAVSVTGLRKTYGDHVVLDGIDLDVPAGTVFALLGPNGAGKTTVVQILSTLIPADGGTALVSGHDVAREPVAVRRSIGVTGQFSALDDLLTGTENLRLMADLQHLGAAEGRRLTADLLARFDLVDAADRRVSTYSGGMRRRLDLAMTLVGSPRLIFLDEADELADRVALLDGGRLVAEGTPAELKAGMPGGSVQVRFTDADGLDAAARRHPEAGRDDDALTLTVPSDGTPRSLRRLLDTLPDDEGVADVALHTPDLDDVFLALTGQGALSCPRATASCCRPRWSPSSTCCGPWA